MEFSFNMDAVEVECAEVLASLSETVKMNLDKVNENECTKVLCSLPNLLKKKKTLTLAFFKA